MSVESASDYTERLTTHASRYFAGHSFERRPFDRGPIQSTAPGFHVLVFEPGPRCRKWVFLSAGGGTVRAPNAARLEFLCVAQHPDEHIVERLAMTTQYHSGEGLGLGHTFPIGEPFVPGSTLDAGLVSLPYPFGPELERFDDAGSPVRLLWLLPITAAERQFKKVNGLEVLERLFEASGLSYWDFGRASVV